MKFPKYGLTNWFVNSSKTITVSNVHKFGDTTNPLSSKISMRVPCFYT